MTAAGAQQYVTPHWALVQPFALTSLAAVRPDPPPQYPLGGSVKSQTESLAYGLTQGMAAQLTGPEPEAGHLSASAQVQPVAHQCAPQRYWRGALTCDHMDRPGAPTRPTPAR